MAADLPVNGFPGKSAGVEINLGGDHDLTPADILFRALPKLMQPTQTLEISISVLPNFVYSMRQRSSFSLSAEHREEAELTVVLDGRGVHQLHYVSVITFFRKNYGVTLYRAAPCFLLRCDFSGGVVKCILQGCEHLFLLAVNAALLDTTPLIIHPFPLSEIEEAYCIFVWTASSRWPSRRIPQKHNTERKPWLLTSRKNTRNSICRGTGRKL